MHVRIRAGGGQQWPFLPRKNRMHGSRWQGLETDVATDGELCTTGKPAWNRRAPVLRHAPRQPLTLLEELDIYAQLGDALSGDPVRSALD